MPVILPQGPTRTGSAERPVSPHSGAGPVDAWKVLGWLGFAFLVMSAIDLALGWYPLRFGTPEWEFGTISAAIGGLAIPTLSLYLLLGSAIARDRLVTARVVAIIMVVLAIALAVLCLLYLTAVPIALKAVAANQTVHLGMQKSVIKSLTLFIGYEALYILGGLRGLRRRAASAR